MPTVRGGWLESPPSKPRAWSFLDTHILPFQRGKSGQSFRADRLHPRCRLADPTQTITTCVPTWLIETAGACNQALLSRNLLSAPAERPLPTTTRARTLSHSSHGRRGDA